jgi:hypothetical protein
MMMHLLATSPQVAVERRYPYEGYYYRYFLEWARVPVREQTRHDVWNTGALMHPATGPLGDGLIGPIPWRDREIEGHGDTPLAEALFRAAWTEFSRRAENHTRAHTPGLAPVRYYAEKCMRTQGLVGLDWVTTRRLFLVRDPRDVWLSILAFDAKRGYYGLGRLPDEPENEYLARFLGGQADHLDAAIAARDAGAAPVFRYEDIVTDPRGATLRLERWLELELDADAIVRDRAAFGHHMTSGSALGSVERWRRELSEPLRETFSTRLGTRLRALGYEP